MTIADQKTPGRPVEIEFDAFTGVPSANQEMLLIGHANAGVTGTNTVFTINNVADVDAARTEAEAKFGVGSELAKMVVAAVQCQAATGRSNFAAMKAIPLESTAVGFGTNDAALTAAKNVKAEFVVSCYAGTDTALTGKLKDHCATVSGAQRVENNQFGTIGVVAAMNVADPSNLHVYDSQYISGVYHRDTTGANPYTVGELAAAYAAVLAGNVAPFIPVNGYVLGGVTASTKDADVLSVGAGLESETVLSKGWCPLRTKPNGEIAVVRSVTSRITSNGTTLVQSYYDVQDFQVLYYWRKTVYTRLTQPDLTNVKASAETARDIKSELIRLAVLFEANTMFQSVEQLAKQFSVIRSSSDRHRFDVVTPVNVVPGLHCIASTVRAGTQYDVISV
jgi:phage tail sheath gpL-like